jgi:hypothetical protein
MRCVVLAGWAVKRRDIAFHLSLDVNAVEGSIRLDRQLRADDQKWSEEGRSADFDQPYPVDFPVAPPR